MAKYRVWINYWNEEYEADDEGYALMEADGNFNFMSEARVELVEESEEEQ